MNLVEDSYSVYHHFDNKKLGVVHDELPEKSLYYYVANHLLEIDDIHAYKDIFDWILVRFPDENLNDRLRNKFD